MKIKPLEVTKEFTPEWNGNRDLPYGEQVRITLKRFPSAIERAELVKITQNKSGDTQTIWDYAKAMSYIEKIENLWIGDNEIKTAGSLIAAVEPALYGLITEITIFIMLGDPAMNEGELPA